MATFPIQTRRALLWMNLSHEPFVILYTLLPFIIRKDLHASLLQISILTALRPVLPLFSFYWSANLSKARHRLRSNLISAWVFARLPFLFIPWLHNAWYLIFCCAVYEFFNKSGIPALIEILKINIPKQERERTYTFYFVLSFIESILLGFVIGGLLDLGDRSWQILCSLTSCLALTSLWVQLQVPIPYSPPAPLPKSPIKQKILQPWQEAFRLLRSRPDFTQFQYGFMMGGFGLMLIAPALSLFYADTLQLAHSQVVMGRSIVMGIGVVASSYFWKKSLTHSTPSKITYRILIGFGLFPLSLLLSMYHIYWFYCAFILYGIAQAGSHLLWNLSGTLFSSEEDSSPFSRVNILMVGIRGMIAPALGGILCQFLGPAPLLVIGALTCFAGARYMYTAMRQTATVPYERL